MKIEITIDYAPKENDESFKEWCSGNGFDFIDSSRRAWCGELHTYLRDAIGIAEIKSGGRFLIYEEDLSDEI